MTRSDHADDRSDEVRWRDQGKPLTMTLEERADYIAGAMHANSIGGLVYNRIRERALKQLREVAGLNA